MVDMPYSFNFDILNADENTKYLNMAIFRRISKSIFDFI